MNEDHYLIYVDVDEDGNITHPFLAGTGVIPDQPFRYFFYKSVGEVSIEFLADEYRVVNNELVLKEEVVPEDMTEQSTPEIVE